MMMLREKPTPTKAAQGANGTGEPDCREDDGRMDGCLMTMDQMD